MAPERTGTVLELLFGSNPGDQFAVVVALRIVFPILGLAAATISLPGTLCMLLTQGLVLDPVFRSSDKPTAVASYVAMAALRALLAAVCPVLLFAVSLGWALAGTDDVLLAVLGALGLAAAAVVGLWYTRRLLSLQLLSGLPWLKPWGYLLSSFDAAVDVLALASVAAASALLVRLPHLSLLSPTHNRLYSHSVRAHALYELPMALVDIIVAVLAAAYLLTPWRWHHLRLRLGEKTNGWTRYKLARSGSLRCELMEGLFHFLFDLLCFVGFCVGAALAPWRLRPSFYFAKTFPERYRESQGRGAVASASPRDALYAMRTLALQTLGNGLEDLGHLLIAVPIVATLYRLPFTLRQPPSTSPKDEVRRERIRQQSWLVLGDALRLVAGAFVLGTGYRLPSLYRTLKRSAPRWENADWQSAVSEEFASLLHDLPFIVMGALTLCCPWRAFLLARDVHRALVRPLAAGGFMGASHLRDRAAHHFMWIFVDVFDTPFAALALVILATGWRAPHLVKELRAAAHRSDKRMVVLGTFLLWVFDLPAALAGSVVVFTGVRARSLYVRLTDESLVADLDIEREVLATVPGLVLPRRTADDVFAVAWRKHAIVWRELAFLLLDVLVLPCLAIVLVSWRSLTLYSLLRRNRYRRAHDLGFHYAVVHQCLQLCIDTPYIIAGLLSLWRLPLLLGDLCHGHVDATARDRRRAAKRECFLAALDVPCAAMAAFVVGTMFVWRIKSLWHRLRAVKRHRTAEEPGEHVVVLRVFLSTLLDVPVAVLGLLVTFTLLRFQWMRRHVAAELTMPEDHEKRYQSDEAFAERRQRVVEAFGFLLLDCAAGLATLLALCVSPTRVFSWWHCFYRVPPPDSLTVRKELAYMNVVREAPQFSFDSFHAATSSLLRMAAHDALMYVQAVFIICSVVCLPSAVRRCHIVWLDWRRDRRRRMLEARTHRTLHPSALAKHAVTEFPKNTYKLPFSHANPDINDGMGAFRRLDCEDLDFLEYTNGGTQQQHFHIEGRAITLCEFGDCDTLASVLMQDMPMSLSVFSGAVAIEAGRAVLCFVLLLRLPLRVAGHLLAPLHAYVNKRTHERDSYWTEERVRIAAEAYRTKSPSTTTSKEHPFVEPVPSYPDYTVNMLWAPVVGLLDLSDERNEETSPGVTHQIDFLRCLVLPIMVTAELSVLVAWLHIFAINTSVLWCQFYRHRLPQSFRLRHLRLTSVLAAIQFTQALLLPLVIFFEFCLVFFPQLLYQPVATDSAKEWFGQPFEEEFWLRFDGLPVWVWVSWIFWVLLLLPSSLNVAYRYTAFHQPLYRPFKAWSWIVYTVITKRLWKWYKNRLISGIKWSYKHRRTLGCLGEITIIPIVAAWSLWPLVIVLAAANGSVEDLNVPALVVAGVVSAVFAPFAWVYLHKNNKEEKFQHQSPIRLSKVCLEMPGNGLRIHVWGSKPREFSLTQATLDVGKDAFWNGLYSIVKMHIRIAMRLFRSQMMPMDICPHFFNPEDIRVGETTFHTTIDLLTSDDGQAARLTTYVICKRLFRLINGGGDPPMSLRVEYQRTEKRDGEDERGLLCEMEIKPSALLESLGIVASTHNHRNWADPRLATGLGQNVAPLSPQYDPESQELTPLSHPSPPVPEAMGEAMGEEKGEEKGEEGEQQELRLADFPRLRPPAQFGRWGSSVVSRRALQEFMLSIESCDEGGGPRLPSLTQLPHALDMGTHRMVAYVASLVRSPDAHSFSPSVLATVDRYHRPAFRPYVAKEADETNGGFLLALLELVARQPLMGDELLLQIIRHSRSADDPWLNRGWPARRMLLICLSVFPPSREFEPYLRAYLRELGGAAESDEERSVVNVLWEVLETVVVLGPRPPPPAEELGLMLQGRDAHPCLLEVRLPGGETLIDGMTVFSQMTFSKLFDIVQRTAPTGVVGDDWVLVLATGAVHTPVYRGRTEASRHPVTVLSPMADASGRLRLIARPPPPSDLPYGVQQLADVETLPVVPLSPGSAETTTLYSALINLKTWRSSELPGQDAVGVASVYNGHLIVTAPAILREDPVIVHCSEIQRHNAFWGEGSYVGGVTRPVNVLEDWKLQANYREASILWTSAAQLYSAMLSAPDALDTTAGTSSARARMIRSSSASSSSSLESPRPSLESRPSLDGGDVSPPPPPPPSLPSPAPAEEVILACDVPPPPPLEHTEQVADTVAEAAIAAAASVDEVETMEEANGEETKGEETKGEETQGEEEKEVETMEEETQGEQGEEETQGEQGEEEKQ